MRQTASSSTSSASAAEDGDPDYSAAKITDMLSRLHVLVVGPGLGRDRMMHDIVAIVLRAARKQGMPFVLDADALQIVQRDPDVVKGYEGAVLTPNVVEFGRLCEALKIDPDKEAEKTGEKGSTKATAKVEALARALGGVTVIQKGEKDYISNGKTTLTVDLKGGRKRSGGQGDTLTGSIATFLGWRKAYLDKLWDNPGESKRLDEHELVGLAAFGGSAITKVGSCHSSCHLEDNVLILVAGVLTASICKEGS
jgi:ATP-dependent NAD(P)H-hydrate dehydratase